MSEINDKIRELRKRKGLTLFEVAEYLGVAEATAQRYESGNIKNIKYETICKLAKLFDCDPRYLVGWSSDSSPGTYNSTITNSSVVNGNQSTTLIVQRRQDSDAPLELTDQAVELLRVFNSMSLKGQTLLLSRAFELEEQYGEKE